MNTTEIPADKVKRLEYIETKYDIFFKANNKQFWDYFEWQLNSYATLKVKANNNLPFPLLNELKRDFQLIEK